MDEAVKALIESVDKPQKKQDAYQLLQLMQEVSGFEPYFIKNMIGFGSYHYKYDSGREGDWFALGFSPRKQNLTIYIMAGFSNFEQELSQLGKHKTGKSCLYINKLADIDVSVLTRLMQGSLQFMKEKYEVRSTPCA